MADETIKALAVQVALDDGSFSQGVKSLKGNIKAIDSEFKSSVAGVKNWGKNLDSLKGNAQALGSKINVQKEIIAKYNGQLNKSRVALGKNSQKMADNKTKLDAARSAYEQSSISIGKNAKETKKLKVELDKADATYKSSEGLVRRNNASVQDYTTKLNNAKGALNKMGAALKSAATKIKSQSSQWQNLSNKMSKISKKFKETGEKFSKVGRKMTATITAPIVGIGAAAAKMQMDFEKSASKVSTIADTTAVSMDELKGGVLAISDETGKSASSLNEALYQTMSAGVKTGESIKFLGVATKLAKGGFTDSSTAIDALTTTINAYGLKASDAKSISDELIQTQNLGKTTVAELGSSLGNVIPIAASMGVKTKSLFGSLAELTKNGVKTDEAITGMKGALTSILKPTKEASRTAQQLGLDFSAAHLKNVGWPKFLDEVKEKTGGNSETMAKLFGNVRALNAVTILAGKGGKDFKSILEKMGKTAGATDEAFAKMENNGASKWEKSINKMKNAGIKLGEEIAPIVAKISDGIAKVADKIESLTPAQKQALLKIAEVAAVVGPLLFVFGKTAKVVGVIAKVIGTVSGAIAVVQTGAAAATPAVAALAGVFSAPLLPILAGVAAVAALTVGGIKLYKHLKSDSIPSVQLFGKETSDATKKAVGGYLNLDNKATKSLMNLKFGSKTISKETSDSLSKTFDEMGKKIVSGMDKHFAETNQVLQDFFGKSKALSASEETNILQNMQNAQNKQKAAVTIGTSKIKKILKKASDEKRSLTKDEQKEIAKIQDNMKTKAVVNLSDTELESKAILERMKQQAGDLTAQQSADVVKNAKKQKDKSVKEADEQCDKTIKAIIQQRDGAHTISADEAEKLIKDAEKERDGVVDKHKDMYKKVVSAAKKQAGEHANQVDWETGQVKSKWQVMKESVVSTSGEMWKGVKTACSDAKDGIFNKFGEICDGIKHRWNKTKDDAWQWGADFCENLKKGILSAKRSIENAAGQVGHWIKRRLGHSVPEEGPLADELTWMPDMIDNFARGITDNKYKITGAIKGLATDISVGINPSVAQLAYANSYVAPVASPTPATITYSPTYYTPKALSHAEIARQDRQNVQRLSLIIRR